MAMNKILLPLLPFIMQMLTGHKDQGGVVTQMHLLTLVSTEVKRQLSSLILKIAAGLTATGVLIYSLIVLGQYFHTYLLTFQNGPVFSSIFFAAVSIGCMVGLYHLFRPEKPVVPVQELQASVESFSIDKIYNNFLEGLIEGAERAREEREQREQRQPREDHGHQMQPEGQRPPEDVTVFPGPAETDTIKPREAVADARTVAEKNFGYHAHGIN